MVQQPVIVAPAQITLPTGRLSAGLSSSVKILGTEVVHGFTSPLPDLMTLFEALDDIRKSESNAAPDFEVGHDAGLHPAIDRPAGDAEEVGDFLLLEQVVLIVSKLILNLNLMAESISFDGPTALSRNSR
jgi:hypothetical protein